MKLRACLVAALFAGTSCSTDYAGLEILADDELEPGTVIDLRRVQLPEGRAIRVHARPRSSTARVFDDPEELLLRAENPEVLRIFGDPEDWRWVLVGRAAGRTCIEVVLGGVVEDCIEARVTQR
jgi:hypothetical protein